MSALSEALVPQVVPKYKIALSNRAVRARPRAWKSADSEVDRTAGGNDEASRGKYRKVSAV